MNGDMINPDYFGPPPAVDMVNAPPHYGGKVETIEGIQAALGNDAFIAYCRGQVLKYAWRAGKKGDPIEDLEKAIWYANRAIQTLGGAA